MTEPDIPQRPAGLFYSANRDTLELRLFSGAQPPSPLVVARPQSTVSGARIQLGWGEDGRLYGIALHGASQAVPTSVLRTHAGQLPSPGPMAKDPDDWFLPLFDGAELAANAHVPVHDGSTRPPVSLMLASTGRIVGFIVSDAAAHLPEAMTTR